MKPATLLENRQSQVIFRSEIHLTHRSAFASKQSLLATTSATIRWDQLGSAQRPARSGQWQFASEPACFHD